MLYTQLTKKAIKIAYKAHEGVLDKSGIPYIMHPLHLAEQMDTEDTIVVALLHDVIEDTDISFSDLEKEGFTKKQMDALKLLTHDESVPYLEYVSNIKDNPIARRVKIADLKHNSDSTRMDVLTEKDIKRNEKYKKVLNILGAGEIDDGNEYLDVVDCYGVPTGDVVTRKEAHEKGICHRTSHVWIAKKQEGKIFLMLQKRTMDKDSNPGCYDVSSAGHIKAGTGFLESALRELEEELGITADYDELIYLGQRVHEYVKDFHGRIFHDNQVSNIYLIWKDIELSEVIVQPEEVSGVSWMELSECIEKVQNSSIPNCIDLSELFLIKKYSLRNV